MQLTLISYAICPYVHRAALMLREKNVPFTTKTLETGEKPEWFLAVSPRGKVPVLVVDGTPIFESQVILEYLDETHPPRILPEDPLERARQRAWVEVANDVFTAQYELFSARKRDEAERATDRARARLARFEDELRGRFFAGHDFGLVDIAMAPALVRFRIAWWLTGTSVMDDFPKVQKWAERLAHRPSVVQGAPPDLERRYAQWLRERDGYVFRSSFIAA